jgi:hypothetical protein
MAKYSTYEPYNPSPPPLGLNKPAEIINYTWQELYQIASAVINMDRPTAITIISGETVRVRPKNQSVVYTHLFDHGLTYEFQKPDGTFDTSTGVYTFPEDGLYMIRCSFTMSPMSVPGHLTVTNYLKTSFTYASGAASATYIAQNSGVDDDYVSVEAYFQFPFNKGDTMKHEGGILHDTQNTTTPVTNQLIIHRLSGAK